MPVDVLALLSGGEGRLRKSSLEECNVEEGDVAVTGTGDRQQYRGQAAQGQAAARQAAVRQAATRQEGRHRAMQRQHEEYGW